VIPTDTGTLQGGLSSVARGGEPVYEPRVCLFLVPARPSLSLDLFPEHRSPFTGVPFFFLSDLQPVLSLEFGSMPDIVPERVRFEL